MEKIEIQRIIDELIETVGEPETCRSYYRQYFDLCTKHKLLGNKEKAEKLAIEMRNRGYYVDPISIYLAGLKSK